MFFKCKLCSEKDKRIDDLKSQIDSLKTLVFPTSLSKSASLLETERDQLMSGSSDAISISQYDLNQEASAIVMGSYDQHSQVEVV